MLNDVLTAPPTPAAITIMGSGRLGPTITALLGLAAAVLAARALARARRPADRISSADRDDRPTALLLGLAAVLLGGLFLGAADGGPGTGNGVVGSAAAIVFGSIAIVLDRLAARNEAASSGGISSIEPDDATQGWQEVRGGLPSSTRPLTRRPNHTCGSGQR